MRRAQSRGRESRLHVARRSDSLALGQAVAQAVERVLVFGFRYGIGFVRDLIRWFGVGGDLGLFAAGWVNLRVVDPNGLVYNGNNGMAPTTMTSAAV